MRAQSHVQSGYSGAKIPESRRTQKC